MLENLKENLETHTLDELKEIYKLPKTKLLKEIESQSLSVLYERRTPLTHALIPVSDKRLNKYGNNSKRQKVNEMMCEDFEQRNWPDCEIKRCEEDQKEKDYKLGYLFSKQAELYKEINKILKSKTNIDFYVSLLKKIKQDKDYCAFIEEESYGNRPQVETSTPPLTDEMILGYLSNRLNPLLLMQLTQLLGETNEIK